LQNDCIKNPGRALEIAENLEHNAGFEKDLKLKEVLLDFAGKIRNSYQKHTA